MAKVAGDADAETIITVRDVALTSKVLAICSHADVEQARGKPQCNQWTGVVSFVEALLRK